jgi:hypothetical protein
VPLLDAYLEFLAVRSRPNTVAAVGYDLTVFFTVVGKPPGEVAAGDVLAFITAQYTGGAMRRLQTVAGDRVGVSARTVRRRLSSASGLFAFLHARRGCGRQPGPAGVADPAGTASTPAGGAAGTHATEPAADPGAGLGRRPAGRTAHRGDTGLVQATATSCGTPA